MGRTLIRCSVAYIMASCDAEIVAVTKEEVDGRETELKKKHCPACQLHTSLDIYYKIESRMLSKIRLPIQTRYKTVRVGLWAGASSQPRELGHEPEGKPLTCIIRSPLKTIFRLDLYQVSQAILPDFAQRCV
ncbi:hypothetical protein EVAR_5723_1 [Eumeta japonica]|uniref:Uncharacterized protein n=1 Tax=Eumeta variegata TaxID=151549 RepID=A0A4C1T8A1_EUMVA|nr:hypothetical protein EVAR_5723_1 [Eumeta japonica]